MKKFLIFLVSLVVVVCVGLTTFYFMRNNEIITIKTKEIYCNAGDIIPVKSLGIDIEKANISKKTKFDYNAGGDDVTKYIKYDEEAKAFVVSKENAGEVTLVIRTSNKKYGDFTISVHIGNGSEENPYFIFNENELMRIGSVYGLNEHYKLMNDITLTNNFKPIGFNSSTEMWEGFDGTFNGQGYSIKDLTLNNFENENAGLFASLGENSKVHSLTIENANISGSHTNAGILTGVANGGIEKVAVKNSTLTNAKNDSFTGALAGNINGTVKVSYVDNVTLNVNGTEENKLENVTVGGFAGKVNNTTIQACYANNIQINSQNATSVAGGFAGEFVIGTKTGSIQQSYANTTCDADNFGAFIGTITKAEDFVAEDANMLRHLIGNFAIVNGLTEEDTITDAKLVNNYDNTYFKNSAFVEDEVFFHEEAGLYLVRGFASVEDVITNNSYVYYAVDKDNITTWDTTYVWSVSENGLPTLTMGNVEPQNPTAEYLNKFAESSDIGDEITFVDKFNKDVENENFTLLNDVDLTSGWTPVALKNTVLDGNGKTIKINLNNAVSGNLGLFTTINNSTIKNLNIIVTGVSANADKAGALAGSIFSTDPMSISNIENVTITFEGGFATPEITNFGGVAGTIENTTISGVLVKNLNINKDATLKYAGGLVGAVNENASITDGKVENVVIYGTTFVGGVAGTNDGTITNVKGDATVKYNSTTKDATVGGVVGTNNATIKDVDLVVNIIIENAAETHVGGVAGVNGGNIGNEGSISDVTISGDKITINVDESSRFNIGGVVGTNNGIIENVVNNIANVGTYYVGANHYVGGVAAINNGKISKVLTQSNLEGNIVGGVVAEMKDTAEATVDQVVVGKYYPKSVVLDEIDIKGDKYIAGVVVNFQKGNITNIQAASKLNGLGNDTRSSLVALIFPYGTSLKNATINSSFHDECQGTKYREVWTDFASYSNKSEFGFENADYDARFNLYYQDNHHGSMQSVVINGSKAGVGDAKASMGTYLLDLFGWLTVSDYDNTEESSFIKVVSDFTNADEFAGEFTFDCAKSNIASFIGNQKATKTLTFDLDAIWEAGEGINLKFLSEIAK